MAWTVSEIAKQLGAEYEGDGKTAITGVGAIREAVAGDLTFLANPRYAADAAKTRASAILVALDWDQTHAAALIRVDDPDAAFARVVEHFAVRVEDPLPGIHPTAIIAEDCVLGRDICVGPYCVIEKKCRIGDGSFLYAGCYLGAESEVGENCRFYSGVSLREQTIVGSRVIVHNGAVIGSDGFGYLVDDQGIRTKIPQVGSVTIGDDVEIGANVTIDRGRFGKTRIGNGVKIDNLVHIAHNCVIGDHVVIVAQVGISGSTRLGDRVVLAGQAGVAGHLEIGAGAVIGARGGVLKDVPAGAYVIGFPAIPHKTWARNLVNVSRIADLRVKVGELEKRIGELEENH